MKCEARRAWLKGGVSTKRAKAASEAPCLQVFHLHLNRLLLHRLQVGPHIIKRYHLLVFDDGASLTWFSKDASIGRMRLFLSSISLLALSLSGAGEWLYYKQYPWVYDAVTNDWIYFSGSFNNSSDGKIYIYRNSTKKWSEFNLADNSSDSNSSDSQNTTDNSSNSNSSSDNTQDSSNQVPTNLYHEGNLAVLQKQASGIIVGNFQAIDPDGDTLQYELTNGAGDGNNTMFTMDTNGTLRTATQFEYQNYQSLDIRVKASDDGNLSVEKSFKVLILESPDFSELPATLKIQLNGSVAMDFILVEPGTFRMGENIGFEDPVITVQLTKPFYLAKYETTLLQYTVGHDSSYVHDESLGETVWNQPRTTLTSWERDNFFTDINSNFKSMIPDGWSFTLPTEAQWEYACKAGVKTYKDGAWRHPPYSTGETITKTDANFGGGVGAQTRSVGYYPPNAWGFYDMHGNVEEVTSTYYHNFSWYEETFVVDPVGPNTGDNLVVRGGHYNSYADWILRSAARWPGGTGNNTVLGFRISIQQQ